MLLCFPALKKRQLQGVQQYGTDWEINCKVTKVTKRLRMSFRMFRYFRSRWGRGFCIIFLHLVYSILMHNFACQIHRRLLCEQSQPVELDRKSSIRNFGQNWHSWHGHQRKPPSGVTSMKTFCVFSATAFLSFPCHTAFLCPQRKVHCWSPRFFMGGSQPSYGAWSNGRSKWITSGFECFDSWNNGFQRISESASDLMDTP